jgi:hypothetical protein
MCFLALVYLDRLQGRRKSLPSGVDQLRKLVLVRLALAHKVGDYFILDGLEKG